MHEIQLDRQAFLVSETDDQGFINFANDDFCQYSGYSLEELIGKPHSIVRHPDMPARAFEDLWASITAGKKWSGFVKNKAKDGGYYWVFTTVYPFVNCDKKQGFISCRRIISEQEKEKYEEVYKKMREGTN